MARILVVDDSNLSRPVLDGILESDGHEVIEARDENSAIKSYFLEQLDLVLLDLAMSGMPEEEVLEKLCQMNSNARVIVATIDLQTLTRAKVEAAGAADFVNKAFIAANGLNVVNAVLKGAA